MNIKNAIFSFMCCIIAVTFLVLMINPLTNLSIAVTTDDVSYTPTLIIDAGHGGEDGGAISDNGILEKDINLLISNQTADLLNFLGFDVLKIRDDDTSLSTDEDTIRSRKVADMKKRLEIFNSSNNNIIISIHQNKFAESKYHGTQIFYSPNNINSKTLAESIKTTVKALLQPENERECKESDSGIYLLKNTDKPAVIVECGFLSNEEECNKLTTNTYQKQMSYSIVMGFLDFYNTN